MGYIVHRTCHHALMKLCRRQLSGWIKILKQLQLVVMSGFWTRKIGKYAVKSDNLNINLQ